MKRTFDIIIALTALIFLMPVFAIIGVFVFCQLGRPVLFRQKRAGREGIAFEIIKFRSMRNTLTPNGDILPDEDRISRFGSLLRSTSLDELPELINIVRGEMSLVGPRPLLMEYLRLYSPEQARRHDVRPGLTGWAQVNGRNSLSWNDKLALDTWYVDHHSFVFDLRILWMTVRKVLVRDGISATGEATMTPFRGQNGEE